MELKLINYNVGYIHYQSDSLIILGFHNSKKLVHIDPNLLSKDETILFQVNRSNALLGIIELNEKEFYIHVKDNNLVCTRFINGDSFGSLILNFKYYSKRFKIQKNKYDYTLKDQVDNIEFTINSRIFETSHNTIIHQPTRSINEKTKYLKIRYENFYNFVEYTKNKDKISLKSFDYSNLQNNNLKITFSRANHLNLKTKNAKQQIKISKLKKEKHLRLREEFKNDLNFPTFLRVGKRIFVIIQNKVNNNVYIKFDKRVNLMLKYSEYNIYNKLNHFKISGRIEFKENPKPDAIMSKNGKILAKLIWKNEKNFEAKIKKSDILKLPNIHNSIYFSKNNEILMPVKRYNNKKSPSKKIVYSSSVRKGKVLIARLNLANNISFSIVPYLPVYSIKSKLKINVAHKIAKIFNHSAPKKFNLYFEKESSKIGESGSYVFEQVMETLGPNKYNYFILDRKAKGFKKMKRKWKNNIVKRFSFRHYLYIFLAKSFISSELSSHVISGRLFNDKLNFKIKKHLYISYNME